MGISPLLWGKEAWHFIHYVALSYPEKPTEKDKQEYMKFLLSLQQILPCPICADNFRKKMEKHPPKLESKQAFFEWTVDVHNSVNESNGKAKLSYDAAEKEIIKNSKKMSDFSKGLLLSVGLTTIIVCLSKNFAKFV